MGRANLDVKKLYGSDSAHGADHVKGAKRKTKKKFVYDPNNDPFILRTGNERMEAAKKMEIPLMLMSELLYQNTVTMLFAETGVGKTLLAFQIVDSLSRGNGVLGLKNEASPLKTLYVDMENGETVFQARYSQNTIDEKGKTHYYDRYIWDDRCNFLDLSDPEKYEVPKKGAIDWWFDLIKYKAEQCEAKVIVIDNLFSIISQGGIESTKEVAPVLRELNNLKKSKGWTIIVVHHTPKRLHGKITRNDLAGSSNLSNLVDAVIGIGVSSYDGDEHSRYIKQIKPSRYSPVKYGETNVISCKTTKLSPNYTGFELIELTDDEFDYKYESTHLVSIDAPTGRTFTDEETKRRMDEISGILKENPDTPKTEIAARVGVTRQTVYTDLKKIQENQLFDGNLNPKSSGDEDNV